MPRKMTTEERIAKFWTRVQKTDSCWIWTAAKNPKGYGMLMSDSGKNVPAPRFSWVLHYGAIPNGYCVCHRCDVPACVRPDHLFIGTAADNIADMVAKGRNRYGEKNHNAKLTVDIVRRILDEYRGLPGQQTQMAQKYGVSQGRIWQIVNGRAWRKARNA